jgi:hypothetical protein
LTLQNFLQLSYNFRFSNMLIYYYYLKIM